MARTSGRVMPTGRGGETVRDADAAGAEMGGDEVHPSITSKSSNAANALAT